MKKILFTLLFITMAFSQSTPFNYQGLYNGAFYVPNATYTSDIVVVDEGDLAGESLNETDFATHANWDVTNDFDDSGGNAAYTWSANQTSTLTQTSGGNLAIDGVADKWYKFEYTVAVTTAFDGDGATTITNAFALVAVSLDLSVGSHIVYFMSAAVPGNFVISVVSGSDTEGTWTIDDVTLKEITGGDVTAFGNILGYGTLGLGSGTTINEISTDVALAGDSDDAVPTEKAVKAYADAIGGAVIPSGSNNEILTDDGAGAIVSEDQLLFDGLDLTVGVSVDDVQPTVSITGDADSDAGDDVSETIAIILTPNANPLLAYWGFTSTQSAGYKFDKAIDVTGNIIVSGTVDGIDIATDVAANTAKNTNVPTELSVGTVGVNTVAITSDGGADDVTLPAALVGSAGLLTTAKWGEIVANNAKVTNTDDQKIDVFSGAGNTISISLEADGEASKTLDISGFTAIAANTAKVVGTHPVATVYVPSSDQARLDDSAITIANTIVRVVGDGGAVLLDQAPSISDGAADGQMVIIQGTSDANTVTIADNTNCQLAGGVNMTLGIGDTIQLIWDSGMSDWLELTRSDN